MPIPGVKPMVCSHMRSGTHYLMAALWTNFEFPDLSLHVNNYVEWHSTGETEATVPWGKMFLTHALCDDRFPVQDILYVYRHPYNTLKSLWSLTPRERALDQFIIDNIGPWKQHVESYLSRGVYSVSYEQTLADYGGTLEEIKNRFGLQAKFDSYKSVEELVGWTPSAGTKTPSTKPSAQLIDKLTETLGQQYLEYSLTNPPD